MNKVQISEDAVQDLNDGFLFYEAQAPGLGDYFAACLKADIEGLKISAGVHRVVAVVWAVIDLRRDPAWIREHLKE